MKFSEALNELKSGKKISRAKHRNEWYLALVEDQIRSYTLATDLFRWTNEIILSNDWIIEDIGGCTFDEMLAAIKSGHKARLPHWSESWIELDRQMNDIVHKHFIYNIFTPTYQDFVAEDWEILN